MFNRKLKEQIKTLELRVQRLECDHVKTEIEKIKPPGLGMRMVWELENGKRLLSTGYNVRCKSCGKITREIGVREKARMEYQQAKEQYNKICGGSDESE